MDIDAFAPNLSFFFSNGMDPEYAVIGRVARRIWARAMRERDGASPRSQMLKYHIQTSGRSLHAQEMQFNDIRTTLQALYAILDNTNSLHTNAYDEAITTPTEESVRRALAVQLIINRELGLNFCENPWQGSFIINELTDLVEAAGVRGVRPHLRARWRPRRDGHHVPARKDPGGESPLRAAQARREPAADWRQTRSSPANTPARSEPSFNSRARLEQEKREPDQRNLQRRSASNRRRPRSAGAGCTCARSRWPARTRSAALLEAVKSASLGQHLSAAHVWRRRRVPPQHVGIGRSRRASSNLVPREDAQLKGRSSSRGPRANSASAIDERV